MNNTLAVILRSAFFLLLASMIHSGIFAADTAQSILAVLDRSLAWGNGLTYGQMILHEQGRMTVWEMQIFTRNQDRLVLLTKGNHPPVYKILYTGNGSNCHVYKTGSGKITAKAGPLLYERIMHTGFSWADLGNILFEADYKPAFMATRTIDGKEYNRIALLPAAEDGYQKLIYLADRVSSAPFRMEFYDRFNQLEKILDYRSGQLPFKKKGGREKKEKIIAMTVTSLIDGVKTDLQFTGFDADKNLPEQMYLKENLDK